MTSDTFLKKMLNGYKDGVFSEQARPKHKDGTVANSKYVTGSFADDLSEVNSPRTYFMRSNPPSKKYSGFTKISPN